MCGIWITEKVPDPFNATVIVYQAIAEDLQAVFVRLFGQQLQIHPPIIVDEEYVLAVVVPLCDVMGTTNRNCSR